MAAQAQHAAAATKLREMSPPVPAAMRWYRMPERVEREWRESGERVERESGEREWRKSGERVETQVGLVR